MEQKAIYQRKIIRCKALDVDTTSKQVKIAIAETENIDLDGDIISPTAADKSIRERGPQGTNEIWHLLDHTAKSTSALSKFSEMGREGKYIWGLSKYKDSFLWREVAWPLYEAGDFTQHSIGFSTNKSQQRAGYRELQDITVYEGSAVLWGANPNTPTMQIVKSAMGLDEIKDDLISRIERMQKAFKMGKFEDDSHRSLFVIEMKQIQQDILDMQKSTEPEQRATPPEIITEAGKLIKSFTFN